MVAHSQTPTSHAVSNLYSFLRPLSRTSFASTQQDTRHTNHDTMFCLRSWLPLLFIPTNASPLFILSFITLTYLLHRPCIYCSALLLILFLSSCHWSDRCFFDFRGDWFAPRFAASPSSPLPATPGFSSPEHSAPGLAEYVLETVNTTATTLADAAVDEVKKHFSSNGTATTENVRLEWTGMGLEWLRSLLGRREWTLPCVDVKVRL